ncbi:MAG TPA: lipoprotein [Gammaproteobacteria bacterium]|nr:lipoprotein [Gammaproteobacteria bacterium]
MISRLSRTFVAVIGISLMLCGCGQKGDLYLPDHKTAPAFIPSFIR